MIGPEMEETLLVLAELFPPMDLGSRGLLLYQPPWPLALRSGDGSVVEVAARVAV